MLEPTMLPIARPYSLFIALTSDTASSGRLVPKATSRMPMTTSLTPRIRAISMLPSTSRCAPSSNVPSPNASQNSAMGIETFSGISASYSALIGSLGAERKPRRASQIITMTSPVSITRPSTRLRKESRNSDTVNSVTASSAGISRRRVAERS